MSFYILPLPLSVFITISLFPQNIKSQQPRRGGGGARAGAALKRNNRGYLLKEAPMVRYMNNFISFTLASIACITLYLSYL
jgi:hypothetical protein